MKQFSVRDVLLLVVIIALALGWWFDRRPPTVGRFQLQHGSASFVKLDTATVAVYFEGTTEFNGPNVGK